MSFKAKRYIYKILLLLSVVFVPSLAARATELENWSHRIKLTVDKTKVSGTQTDFPVYVDLSLMPAEFWDHVHHSGWDIRVTNAAGTELPREVVEINNTGGGTGTGEMHFKADEISDAEDSDFYIYVGNSNVNLDYNEDLNFGKGALWSEYLAVYHLNNDPVGGLGSILDSSPSAYHANPNGLNSVNLELGKLGKAINFPIGSGDYISKAIVSSNTVKTISAWVKHSSVVQYTQRYVSFGNGFVIRKESTGFRYYTRREPLGDLQFNSPAVTGTANINTWYYVTGSLYLQKQYHYINNTLITSETTNTNALFSANSITISQTGTESMDGIIDEVRLSTAERSSDWIATEYENQNTPSNFFKAPVSEPNYLNQGFSHRIKFTLNGDLINAPASGSLTDFPVYLDLSQFPSDFFSRVMDNGEDIRITAGDAFTELPREVVDVDTTAKTGEVHFKTDLENGADATFYLYYGNGDAVDYGAADTYGAENVWTKYTAVWHMGSSLNNSAEANLNGSSSGVVSTTEGQIGTSSGFTQNSCVLVPDNANNDLDSVEDPITISVWINPNDYNNGDGYQRFLVSRHPKSPTLHIHPTLDATMWSIPEYTKFVYSSFPKSIYQNKWTLITASFEPDTLFRVLYNGALKDENTNPSDIPSDLASYTEALGIGCQPAGGDSRSMNGDIDEVRYTRQILSLEWIETEYQNQKKPSQFILNPRIENKFFSDGWTKRKEFTLNGDLIEAPGAGSLTDFPVYLDLSLFGDEFFDDIKANGEDIRITDANNQELAREIVWIDKTANGGELHFKATLEDSTDKSFYIYYGNPDANDYSDDHEFGRHSVWNDDYVLVSHDGGLTDSTRYSNDGTGINLVPNTITGQIGQAQDFNGNNQYISYPGKSFAKGQEKLSLSAWVYIPDLSIARTIFNEQKAADTGTRLSFNVDSNAKLSLKGRDDDTDSFTGFVSSNAGEIIQNEWTQVYGVFNATTDQHKVYKNGNNITSSSSTGEDGFDNTDSKDTFLGLNNTSSGNYFSGTIDEIRISNTDRSSEWISTEYANQNTPSSFILTGATHTKSDLSTWKNHIKFTLNGDLIDAGGAGNILEDFPVYLDLSLLPKEFFWGVKSNGADIRITDAEGLELAREVVDINTTAKTGELHFKTDLEHLTDKDFYIYFNKPAAKEPVEGEPGYEKDVWSDYMAVYHLGDNPKADLNSIKDSSPKNHHLTFTGFNSSSLVESKIAKGINFVDGEYMGASISSTDSQRTISTWVKLNDFDLTEARFIRIGDYFSLGEIGNEFRFYTYRSSSGYIHASPFLPVNNTDWFYITGTYDGQNQYLYVDGIEIGTASNPNPIAASNTILLSAPGASGQLHGILDESRISTKTRSENWIKTEYKNQNTPSAFIQASQTIYGAKLKEPAKAVFFGGF